MMNNNYSLLQKCVLATLTYHDLLGMPLTATECWRYLFKYRQDPQIKEQSSVKGYLLFEVEKALSQLVREGTLVFYHGFYAFPHKENMIDERIHRHALAQPKWTRLRIIAWFLQAVPFVDSLAVSGSLSRELARDDSDLDVLLITKSGRIWTARFIVTVALDLFHLRRRPTGPTKDLICLNHYIAADALRLPYQSVYTALEYARLVPLFGLKTFIRFRDENREWMNKYLIRVFPDEAIHLKTVRPSVILRAIKFAGEWILGYTVGDFLENYLGNWQKRRIEKGTTKSQDISESGSGRIIASSMHLEFHPHSHEAELISGFNGRMRQMHLSEFGGQKDSGLS